MTTALYAFEITLQAQPAEAVPGPVVADEWGTWPTILVPKESLAAPMTVGFDDAIARLGALERLYAEPDGSVVWACSRKGGASDVRRWQVDGNAYDREGRVLLVDLKGSCPPAEFDRLLVAFGWPEQDFMFQLVRAATFLDEPTFRRHALARGTVGDGETLRPA
jgi:hypothetical protein